MAVWPGMDTVLFNTAVGRHRGQVAPLVGTTGLPGAAVAAVEFEVVVALQHLVRTP